MVNNKNVASEFELYTPMRLWLQKYLEDKYKNSEIITVDTHAINLDKALFELGITNNLAVGLDIQIDVLGVVKQNDNSKLFFIEAKKTGLTLRDLGQLWAYCRLIDPEEAFLFTSKNLGSLNKILNVFKREDLLDFGDGKKIKKMKVGVWNINAAAPEHSTIIPKI